MNYKYAAGALICLLGSIYPWIMSRSPVPAQEDLSVTRGFVTSVQERVVGARVRESILLFKVDGEEKTFMYANDVPNHDEARQLVQIGADVEVAANWNGKYLMVFQLTVNDDVVVDYEAAASEERADRRLFLYVALGLLASSLVIVVLSVPWRRFKRPSR